VEERLNGEELSLISSLTKFNDDEAMGTPIPDGLLEYWAAKGGNSGKDADASRSIPEDVAGTEASKAPVNKKYVGTVPKYQKAYLLHQLCFYITRGYEGDVHLDQETAWAAINQELRDNFGKEFVLPDEEIKRMPRLYRQEISWKMFIPPLPVHPGKTYIYS
jgi:hypothetical protein